MKTQKTEKKSMRKKALLSSVAMLMVATVAVGSATFAWFTSSTTTTADGLNVKTVKSSELVISKSDRSWDQEIHYGQNGKTLRPASSSDGTKWYRADAENKSAFGRTGDFEAITAADLTSYVYSEELNIANKGSAAVEGVNISISGLTNRYARIALVEVNGDGSDIAGKTFATSIHDSDNETYEAANGAKTTTGIEASKTMTIPVGNLAGKVGNAELGEAKYFKLYVWFEGQDAQCFDTNAGQAIGNIKLSISGTTETQTDPTQATP